MQECYGEEPSDGVSNLPAASQLAGLVVLVVVCDSKCCCGSGCVVAVVAATPDDCSTKRSLRD